MKRLAFLMIAALALSACSMLPTAELASDSESAESGQAGSEALINDHARSRLIALDFVEAMVQLPELPPSSTTLYTALPKSRFAQVLILAMQDAGYDLRIGNTAEPVYLDYSIVPREHSPVADQARYSFLISVASVKLKRDYRVDASGVYPTSSMFLHGSDAGQLALSNQIFARQSAQLVSKPVNRRAPAPAAAAGQRPNVQVAAIGIRKQARRLPSAGAIEQAAETAPPRKASRNNLAKGVVQDKKNLFVTRQSNFQEVLKNYAVLRKEVLIFPNDSIRMLAENKVTAREIVAQFDPGRDIISLIGCSHGKSALANGNEQLANGRASRVKREFVLAGIDPELLLEEGCWAATHFDKMPARGVVVTHRRRGPVS